MNPEELEELEEDVDPDLEDEPDVEELDDEDSDLPFEDDDDDVVVAETEDEEEEEEDDDDVPTTRAKRRTTDDEEDEDEDLLAPDDVEADLDRILKDRLVTADDDDEDDEDEDEPDDRSDSGDRLQPKRADEQLCSQCFLLVRATAPNCPVGDDACPIFS